MEISSQMVNIFFFNLEFKGHKPEDQIKWVNVTSVETKQKNLNWKYLKQ